MSDKGKWLQFAIHGLITPFAIFIAIGCLTELSGREELAKRIDSRISVLQSELAEIVTQASLIEVQTHLSKQPNWSDGSLAVFAENKIDYTVLRSELQSRYDDEIDTYREIAKAAGSQAKEVERSATREIAQLWSLIDDTYRDLTAELKKPTKFNETTRNTMESVAQRLRDGSDRIRFSTTETSSEAQVENGNKTEADYDEILRALDAYIASLEQESSNNSKNLNATNAALLRNVSIGNSLYRELSRISGQLSTVTGQSTGDAKELSHLLFCREQLRALAVSGTSVANDKDSINRSVGKLSLRQNGHSNSSDSTCEDRVNPSNPKLFDFGAQPSGHLYAILLVCTALIGAAIANMRQLVALKASHVDLAFHLAIGGSIGVVVYFAIDGGARFLINQTGTEFSFNPASSAFVALLAGMFTGRVFAFLMGLLDHFSNYIDRTLKGENQ